jgi:RHS repeat-associated protein
MTALLVVVHVASLVIGQVAAGNTTKTGVVTTQAAVGGGCTPGDYQTCVLTGCAGAQQLCKTSNTGGTWGTCTCAVRTCTTTPCLSGALSFDLGGGWVCPSLGAGTLCGNGITCNGSETCDGAGVCIQGAPPTLQDSNPTTWDFCDATGAVQHAPITGTVTPQPSGQVYAAAGTPGSPLAFSTPRMPSIGAPTVNENKGTLNYDYTFDLPKARGKFQPSLRLSYSSASLRNDGAGVGWSLSAFFIEAQPAVPLIFGLPHSIAVPQVKWWINFGHSTRRLLPVSTGSDHYQTDLQGQFVSIVVGSDGAWTATDVVGSIYTFSHHTSRSGVSGTGRYYLARVVDVDGNTTIFNYTDVGTAADLTSIQFNNYRVGSTVLFATEIALSYSDLFPVRYSRVADAVAKRSKMLKTVAIKGLPRDATAQTTSSVLVSSELGYARIQQGSSLVLSDVTVRAGTASMPPVRFAYSEAPGSYQLADGVDLVAGIDPQLLLEHSIWLDVDGDGLVDRVDPVSMIWQRNVTGPAANQPAFALKRSVVLNFQNTSPPINIDFASQDPVLSVFLDINGDGVVDIFTTGSVPGCEFQVIPGRLQQVVTASGIAMDLEFNGSAQTCVDASTVWSFMKSNPYAVFPAIAHSGWAMFGAGYPYQVLDATGDGVPDILISFSGGSYLAQGGWAAPGQISLAYPRLIDPWSAGLIPGQFNQEFGLNGQDLNGDGLPGDNLGSTFNEGITRSALFDPWIRTQWAGPTSPEVAAIAITYPDGYAGTAVASSRGGPWSCSDCSLGPTCADGGPLAPRMLFAPKFVQIDLDGDGRTDLVAAPTPGSPSCPAIACPSGVVDNMTGADLMGKPACQPPSCPLEVWWNTGSGFERSLLLAPHETSALGATLATLYPNEGSEKEHCYYSPSYPNGRPNSLPFARSHFTDLDGDGVADYVTAPSGARFFKGQGNPIQLTGVTIPTGATYSITYAPAMKFGAGPRDAPRSVPVQVSLSGPDILSASTSYSYASPRHGTSPFDTTETEPRGFETTWSWLEQPGTSEKVAQRTRWAVTSHAFDGAPLDIAEGGFSGASPSDANFTIFRRATSQFSARAPGNTNCTTADPPVTSYPGLVVVTTYETWQPLVESGGFFSAKTRTCSDVDDLGNSLRTYVDPDTSFMGDEYIEVAAFDATATCRTCPVETRRTTMGGTVIANSKYRYDSAQGTWASPLPEGRAGNGHLNYVSRWVSSGTVRWEIESAIAYTQEGSVLSKVTDPFPGSHALSSTETYSYDVQRLRVTDTVTQDASVTLGKHVDYDPIHGWAVQETGPFVGTNSAGAPTRAFARDVFGRVVAIGSSRSETWVQGMPVVTIGRPTSVTEYLDWRSVSGSNVPGLTVTSYSFMAPPPAYVQGNTVPSTADVKQAIEYKDSLGRTVQVKERLGTASTVAAEAQIAQVLTGYRSISHVSYDVAGRAVASLEPYFTFEAQDGFATAAGVTGRKGSLTRFDTRGRVSCAQAGVYAVIAADAACTSDPLGSPSYRMSTRFEYRTSNSAAGRLLAVTRAYPPSSTGNAGWVEAGYDGDGMLALTTDAAGNTVTTAIEPMAVNRSVTVTRLAAGVPLSAQTSKRLLDSMGRTLEETEDNWSPSSTPSHRYTYDTLGRAYIVELAPQLIGAWNVRPQLRTEWKSLGRKTRSDAYEPVLSGYGVGFSTRNLATYTYDTPWGANFIYTYTAGHLASVTSPLTTIALGYDEFGQQVRRDQWLAGLGTATFTSTALSAADGRLLSSQFDSNWSKSVWTAIRYDSAGRPVQVDDGGALKLWQVRNATNLDYDGYDAQGRTGNVASNGGTVTTVRHYNQYSGSMSDQATQFTAGTIIYKIGSFGYQGSKLTSLSDQTVAGKATTVNYLYDPQGRLTAANAVASALTPISQSYTESYRQGDPAWMVGSSLGNLGQVSDASGTTGYAYAADRVAEQYGGKNFLFKYDHAGRLVSRLPRLNGVTGAETEGFAWDVQDQLRQVRTAGSVSEVIDYDPTGLPLFRRVGTVGTWYVGKLATVTATVNGTCMGAAACGATITPAITTTSTPAVAVHLLLGGTRIATVRPPNQAATTAAFAEVLYYHRDYQGSVIGTSRRGAGVDGLTGAQYRYTPYGQLDKVTGVTAQTDSELGYTGGLRLGYVAGAVTTLATPQAPGLVLLGARVYHPELKRWLVPDTVDPLRYTYTGGDPVNFIDPSGRTMIDGHSLDMKSRPVMFEDYFMGLTAQYGTAGFDTAMRHLREDSAWAAGFQGPVPQWESAYRAELARESSQYLNDVMAEAMATADAFAREAAAKGLADQSASVLAQAYADFAKYTQGAMGAMAPIASLEPFVVDVNSQDFQSHVGAGKQPVGTGECYALASAYAPGMPAHSDGVIEGPSFTEDMAPRQGTVFATGFLADGSYPKKKPYGHTIVFDKYGEQGGQKGVFFYQQWTTGMGSNGVRYSFMPFNNSLGALYNASNYSMVLKRMTP